jgi:cob(I)alamin adenosyltransferase
MKMAYNKDITPKQIKRMEKVIDEVKNKKRPIRAEVMPCTVPAWGSMRTDEGKDKCEK